MPKKVKELPLHIGEFCGNCLWFTEPQGESELTCVERSGVTKNVKACRDFTLKPFNASLLHTTDSFLIKFKDKLSSAKFIIDKSVKDELTQYFVLSQSHKEGGKNLRHIPTCSYGPREASKLISLFEKTQSLRDRALSIKLGMFSLMVELKTQESIGKQYIFKHYGKYMQNMKTESIRQTIMDILMSPLDLKIKEISGILESANLVYENLKDTYFTLKEVKDIACSFLQSTKMTA